MKTKIRGFEPVLDKFKINGTPTILPIRSTKYSAGYDFICPVNTIVYPHKKLLIYTDVKAYMQENEVLMLYIRSSLGIKKNVVLANQTGVIDMDYYSNPDNDGNIGICLYNNSDMAVELNEGDKIVQGVFFNFLTAYNCNTKNVRQGGIGSTN